MVSCSLLTDGLIDGIHAGSKRQSFYTRLHPSNINRDNGIKIIDGKYDAQYQETEQLTTVVRKVNNVIQQINRYPVDSIVCFLPLISSKKSDRNYIGETELYPAQKLEVQV